VEQLSVREVSERIDALLDELGQSTVPGAMERVEELVHAVMSLYGAGLERIVATVDADTVRRLADDEVVGNLLVLHDLHPDDVDTRVQRALEQVRPYLGSHAGGVSLSGVDEQGVVHLRLEGSCDGCPSSAMTVKSAIEDAILVAAPDVVAVEAEGMVETGPALLQIEPFGSRGPDPVPAGGWEHLDLDVPPRTLRALDVAGDPLVVANLDGTLVAYADRCPACLAPLSEGRLDGDRLTCAGGHAYDVRRAGRALDEEAAPLTPLPLLPDHGAWKVSLPRKVSA
jgi:Fe-S cluster biogenesis protein NfuA/nitrite reductase/ring-hydroxylating ferredoxin subunit